MKDSLDNLLDDLVAQIKDPAAFNEVKDQLFKRGIQALLKAEMDAHLGYQRGDVPITNNVRNGYSTKTLKTNKGDVTIDVPRDRRSTFDPVTVPKHQTITQELESAILLLYAKGMSNADVIDYIEKVYGVKYSTSQVSVITNSLLEDIRIWQSRPLQDQYAVIWIDAIHYKIRQDGKVMSKAAMVILGIDMEGKQDILSLHIVENESASSWMEMLTLLKARGVQDILFLCSDNLPGLDKAIEAVYPKSIRQICIVHQIRNSLNLRSL